MNPPHPALEKFVARLRRRSPLNQREQQALLQLPYRVIQVHARTDIVSPGKLVNHASLVARGLVARYDQLRDGKRQITSFHIPGDMCDLLSLMAPIPAWGMTALPATTVLLVPHSALGRLALEYPQIGLAFWRDTTADATVLAKWLVNLGRHDARGRLAHLLCEMGVRMEAAGLGTATSFTLGATQEQLADALGLTPVHVNRMMQGLRHEGLLEVRSQHVQVLDWSQLVRVAEFEPAYLLLDEPVSRDFGTPPASDRSETEFGSNIPSDRLSQL